MPDLITESWRFTEEYSFMKVTGEVTNNTNRPLANVTAVASFYTANGTLVKTDEALISYNPVLPGQTSPFTVIDTSNPAIKSARISFKYLFGGTISAMSRKELEEPSDEEVRAKAQARADEDARRKQAQEDEAAEKLRALNAAKTRTWKTADGKFEVEAKFISFGGGLVSLEKPDGKTIKVKMDILSVDDQEFIRERKWLRN